MEQKSFWSYTQAKVMAVVIIALAAVVVVDLTKGTEAEEMTGSLADSESQVEAAMAQQDEPIVYAETDSPEKADPTGEPEDPNAADNLVYDFVDVVPQFPGGLEACIKWMGENVKYPSECTKENIKGRVIASFVVNKDGSISNVEILRSPDERLSAEAVRVIKAMPKWTPGEINGKKVRTSYTLPIKFRLI